MLRLVVFNALIAMFALNVNGAGNPNAPSKGEANNHPAVVSVSHFGTVKTLMAAREAVRRLSREASHSVVIELADGIYPQTEAFCLTSDDSGTPGRPIIYRARHRGKAVVTGAVQLDWRSPSAEDLAHGPLALLPLKARGHVVIARIPGVGMVPGFYHNGCRVGKDKYENDHSPILFQGGERLQLAREPDDGYYRMGKCFGGESRVIAYRNVNYGGSFKVDDAVASRLEVWAKEPDLWAYGLWRQKYADACLQVVKADAAERSMKLRNQDRYSLGFVEGGKYFVCNAFSALDRPGEWAVDRKSRLIAFWPKADVAAEPPTLAACETLLRLKDVHDVTFEGLVFEGTAATPIDGSGCVGVNIIASLVRRTGGGGIRLAKSSHCRVEGCDLYDLGEFGIWLGGGDTENLVSSENAADNNHIHHYGRITPNYNPAVSLNGVGCSATHNLIHHSRHQGVYFFGNDHRIAYNIIHDTVSDNDDAGSVYCCGQIPGWTARGTVIEHNLVHETGNHPQPVNCHAFYFDDWSSGVRLANNIISRASCGVLMGGGQGVAVVSNVIVRTLGSPISFCSRMQRRFWGGKEVVADSHLMRKLAARRKTPQAALWESRYPGMFRPLEMDDPVYAHNALWCRVEDNLAAACAPYELGYFSQVKADNVWTRNESVDGDPGFLNYRKLDFRPRPGTANAALIAATDFERMGLYRSARRFSPAVRYGEGVTYPTACRREYAPARVRLDIYGSLPTGVTNMATHLVNIELPLWAKGNRLCGEKTLGLASRADWQDYVVSFVPSADMSLTFEFMGGMGEYTVYDDVRAEGVKLRSPGFEDPSAWRWPKEVPAQVGESCVEPPWGVCENPFGLRPAEGRFVAIATQRLTVRQDGIAVKKGVPVTVRFKARAVPFPEEHVNRP